MTQMLTMTMMAAALAAGLSAQTTFGDTLQQALRDATAKDNSRQATSDWRPVLSFNLQIEGSAGGNSFQSTGRLYLVTGQLPRIEDPNLRSDVNQLEMMIADDEGRFRFATNTYLLRRAGAMTDMNVDLAEVKVIDQGGGGEVEVSPVKAFVPLAAGGNRFTLSNGHAGPSYQIAGGSLRLRITAAGELTGSMEVQGMNLATQGTETLTVSFSSAPEGLGVLDASQSNTIRALPSNLKR